MNVFFFWNREHIPGVSVAVILVTYEVALDAGYTVSVIVEVGMGAVATQEQKSATRLSAIPRTSICYVSVLLLLINRNC
jgi:hypothetical protein